MFLFAGEAPAARPSLGSSLGAALPTDTVVRGTPKADCGFTHDAVINLCLDEVDILEV